MTTIAIVGAGYMGRTHAEAWASLGLAQNIKYIASRRVGEPMEHAPAAEHITDIDTVLNDPEVDVVSICTPTRTHRDIAVRMLEAGKNVVLEKPLALTVDDALAIREAAERADGKLMIAHVVRFFDGYRRLRDDVAAGELGSILSARARRYSSRPDWAEWLHDESQSGGMIVDFAIHDFDQMNLFLGEPVRVTCAARGALGPVETTIEYRDGGIGQVLSFTDLPATSPFSSSIGIIGTEGYADYEFAAGAPTEHADDASNVSRYRTAGRSGPVGVDLAADNPYGRQLEYFLECIAAGTAPAECTIDDAVRALEVALAASASLRAGTPVLVNSVVPAISDPTAR